MANKIHKFWNISQIDDFNAEVLIYDDIASKQSVDWWGEHGTEVTPTAFREELQKVTATNISVRINSGGGDVFAAESIATIIKEEREKGKTVTCKIDGICASAAVQIAMACESIAIPKSAYMMIHDPLTFLFGYYQAENLEKTINTLNKIKSGIVNAYIEKTGIEREEIENLMTAETWFTGDEAVEKGFADEILFGEEEEEEVTDSIGNLFKNGLTNRFAAFINVPEALKNTALNVINISNTEKTKGAKGMEIKNSADLMAMFPEFVNELTENARTEAVREERERIQAIDELSGTVDAQMLNDAKYVNFSNAADVALDAMKNGKFVNTTVLNNIATDAKAVNDISGGANGGVTPENTKENELKAECDVIDKIAAETFKK